MKRVFKYAAKYKLLVLIPFAAMLSSMILDMFNPYLSKVIVDNVITKGETKLLVPVLSSLLGIALVRAILGYIKEYAFDIMGIKVHKDLKRDLFNHIQSLPFNYFDGMNTGELMSRIGEDIENVWRALAFGISIFVENALYFVIAAGILLKLNWQLTLFSLVTMPVIAYLAVKLEKSIGKTYEKISDQAAAINTTAQENIAGVRLVKAFAREKHEILKFLELNKQNYTLNMEQNYVTSKYFPVIEFLSNISVIAVVSLGGIFIIKDNMTLGTLVAFNGYIWMLIWPMRMLGWLSNLLAQSNASAKKIFKIMDIKPSIKDKDNAIKIMDLKGHVKFENVSFKYNDEYVLKDINIDAKPGQTIAVMGTTGSGKSTLMNLIGRYYDVTEGKVIIDGNDVKDICLHDLRSRMSIVPQDVFLFSESISDNIRLGKEDAGFEEIVKASEAACVDEFISELEDGYDTVVGERGIGLSGGQKQRISIARALVRDSGILILDDSTSALDMETEYRLLKNLHSRDRKVTTFIIAHRISAVKNADEIIYMENGKILERGTHEQLLNKMGKYYEIYCEQFKDFDDASSEVI